MMRISGKWNCIVLVGLTLPALMSCRFLRSSEVLEAQEITRASSEAELDFGALDFLAQKLLVEAGPQGSISMDQFMEEMKALPGGRIFFNNFTASFETIANQGASREWPRVIMTNERGSLTMSFTHDSNLHGDQIEFIQVDPLTHERVMFSVTFPITATRMREFKNANPSICLDCHKPGKVVHHLWGRYPNWPGVIGSRDDFVAGVKGRFEFNLPGCDTMLTDKKDDYGNNMVDAQGQPVKTPTFIDATDDTMKEYEALMRLQHLSKSGAERYRHLEFPDAELAVNPLYPYSNAVKAHFRNRPNFRFGGLWHRLHINHVMHLAESTGKTEAMGDLFLYGSMGCHEVGTPDSRAALFARLGLDPATKESNDFWMNAGLKLIGFDLVEMSINEDIAKRAAKTGYFPGSDSSDRLISRLLMERDAARGAEARYPHDTYIWNTGDACNLVRGIGEYKYLDKFGHRPEVKSLEDKKRLCGAITDHIVGRE